MTRLPSDRLAPYPGGNPLTQLIAAIADGGKTVVGLSDRMVTTGDMTLGFESPNRKAQVITSNCVVLMAGTVHEPDLVTDCKDRAKGKDRVRDVAEVFVEQYLQLRRKRIEDEVLQVRAGINSFAEYHQKQQHLHESVVFDLNAKIRDHDLGLQLVLIGMDDKGHIFHIFNPGESRSFDSLGYCTIGMGDRHADNVFAWYRYSSSTPLNEALYIGFEAKKKAEMAGGVGPTTDALIIDSQGIRFVEKSTVDTLLEIYNEREHGAQRRSFDKRITELKLETRKPENS